MKPMASPTVSALFVEFQDELRAIDSLDSAIDTLGYFVGLLKAMALDEVSGVSFPEAAHVDTDNSTYMRLHETFRFACTVGDLLSTIETAEFVLNLLKGI